jgi:FkbM family methyltransferase
MDYKPIKKELGVSASDTRRSYMKFVRFLWKVIKNILPYYITHKYQIYEQVNNRYKNLRLSDVNKLERISIKDRNKNEILLKVFRNDCKYAFYLRDKTMDLGTYQQIFIDKEYNFVANSLPKVIIDAGANIGLASIYFANKFPEAKIIAIEPEARNFELLEKNISKHLNIIPLQAALWGGEEQINLLDTGLGTNAYMTVQSDSSDTIKTPKHEFKSIINTVTIEKIFEDYNIDRVDILKIDIEGSEKEVFNNSKNWIQKVDAIIIELHERMKDGCCRAFYNNTIGFDNEWSQGENIYLTRNNCISKI